MRKNGTLNFIIGDHLGSTSLVTDATGNVISEMRYKACPLRLRYGMLREGETRHVSGTEQTKYTYTGQYSYASDFGLHFYNARWYDSSLGRFNQPDTIIPPSQGVQGYDRYAYVSNNPVKYTDPTGRCPWCIAIGVGAIAGAAVGYGAQVYNNYQNGLTGADALTTNISAEPIVNGAFIGAGVVLGVGLIATAPIFAAPAAAAGAACKDGDCTNEVRNTAMSARNIRWTQDSATWKTKKGIALDQLADDMKGKGWNGDPLRVVKFENKFWSLDNRRLAAAKLVDIDVPVKLYNTPAHPEIRDIWTAHFTTSTFGLNINIVEKMGGPSLGISIRMNGSVRFFTSR